MSEEHTVWHLTELLDQKNEEIADLSGKLEEAERRLHFSPSGWCMPRQIADEHPELPLPRLEMVWTPDKEFGWRRYQMEYRLVVMHLADGLIAHPLGLTTSSSYLGENPLRGGADNALPHRDGFHAIHDAAHLGLPFYAITPEGPVNLTGLFVVQHKLGLESRRG